MSATVAPEGPRHLLAEDPGILRCINEPELNLSLWQRAPLESVAREVAHLQATDSPDVRLDC